MSSVTDIMTGSCRCGQRLIRGRPDESTMAHGVDVESEEVGSGDIANRGKTVVVRLRGTLHRGDVFMDTKQYTFKVGARVAIAGLEYGVEGMRVEAAGGSESHRNSLTVKEVWRGQCRPTRSCSSTWNCSRSRTSELAAASQALQLTSSTDVPHAQNTGRLAKLRSQLSGRRLGGHRRTSR